MNKYVYGFGRYKEQVRTALSLFNMNSMNKNKVSHISIVSGIMTDHLLQKQQYTATATKRFINRCLCIS
ncbi:unknown [Prevotella sp. CAG:924]|nr:unknown [Prevotella sp. CAG:924]